MNWGDLLQILDISKLGTLYILQGNGTEFLHLSLLKTNIVLDLDPAVVDRTVCIFAKYLLSVASLAFLALSPQILVLGLHGFHLKLLGHHNFESFVFAAFAQRLVGFGRAVDAGGEDFNKFAKHVVFVYFWHVPVFGVVAEEKAVEVGDYVGFHQQTLKWRSQLLLDIVVIVDGYVLIQDPDRVLRVFVVLGTLLASDHHVADAVSNAKGDIFIPLLHLMRKFNVGLLDLVGIFAAFAGSLASLIVLLVLSAFGYGLGDHQFGDVDLVLDQITHHPLYVVHDSIGIILAQQQIEDVLEHLPN